MGGREARRERERGLAAPSATGPGARSLALRVAASLLALLLLRALSSPGSVRSLLRDDPAASGVVGAAAGAAERAARAAVERAKPGHLFYFAYASDLLEDRMRSGSSRSARRVTVGAAPGFSFDYTIFSKVWNGGVADLVESGGAGSPAWGAVWEFPEGDLEALDKQKGVGGADPKYRRFTLEVVGSDGRRWPCFSYSVVAAKRVRVKGGGFKRFKPSVQYRACVLRGARESGLPPDYVERLEAIADSGEEFRRKDVGSACG
jgi:gamma-glutamylcyclotransferase